MLKLVPREGFEPTIFPITNRALYHLSYLGAAEI